MQNYYLHVNYSLYSLYLLNREDVMSFVEVRANISFSWGGYLFTFF